MSSPGDRDRTADAATMGRSAQVLASGLVAARFLPIWVGMAVLVLTAALFAPSTLENTSWSYILPYGTILAIAALGQMLVVMQAGIDLSTPAVISFGGNLLVAGNPPGQFQSAPSNSHSVISCEGVVVWRLRRVCPRSDCKRFPPQPLGAIWLSPRRAGACF